MQHHANLIIGKKEWALSLIPKEHKREIQDVHILDFEKMNIANARDLIRESSLKPVESEISVFIISTKGILREAQNALLKLLEDPNPQTIFYFILPSTDLLIPTLLSRFHLMETNTSVGSKKSFEEFKKLSYKDRLKLIEKKTKEEDKEWVNDIVHGLEIHAHETNNKELIEDTLMILKYININGSSKKMLLEHVAFSL